MKTLKDYASIPDTQYFKLSAELAKARKNGDPIVALESTVITHGLPWPENLKLAQDMERTVRENGAAPATIAVLDGKVNVGLSAAELESLAQAQDVRKISLRDFGAALAQGASGGTTVAATMFAAERFGLRVFATGGIGGVHRGGVFDISADLQQLGRSPVMVVCAGAKAILDLPATLEYLETQGVPVVGYQTDTLPAFYSVDSGLKLEIRADSPEETARIAELHWQIGLRSGVLVVVPPPTESATPFAEMEVVIQEALRQAEAEGVHGNAITPFLLARISKLSGGESLKANLALLLNNARVGAQIASKMRPKAPPSRLL